MKYLLFINLFVLTISNSLISKDIKSDNLDFKSECIQTYEYDAHIYYSGYWHTGKVWINQSKNGYKLLSYSFDLQLTNGNFSGDFDERLHRLYELNPNNELAKRNNFTHYITVQNIKVYISLS
jgi:hypothetical protein